MTSVPTRLDAATKMLTGDDAITAGARAAIKRAARKLGIPIDNEADPELLAGWALAASDRIAEQVARIFESAAQEWVSGNNSGKDATLRACETRCDRLRAQAGRLCGMFGVERIDFPGLYPTYHAGGRSWHYGDEAAMFRDLIGGGR